MNKIIAVDFHKLFTEELCPESIKGLADIAESLEKPLTKSIAAQLLFRAQVFVNKESDI